MRNPVMAMADERSPWWIVTGRPDIHDVMLKRQVVMFHFEA
jgi:hypothetical protein